MLFRSAGVRIIGEARHKTGVLSFLLEGAHPHDAGTILDQQGIAVRTGQHCAQPVMDKFCIPATIRASLGIYNSREDTDALVRGLHKVREVFVELVLVGPHFSAAENGQCLN